MVILVSEISNRYANLFLVEMEYFGFNTLAGVMKYLAYMNILFWDN
jgi:hypothetical protein